MLLGLLISVRSLYLSPQSDISSHVYSAVVSPLVPSIQLTHLQLSSLNSHLSSDSLDNTISFSTQQSNPTMLGAGKGFGIAQIILIIVIVIEAILILIVIVVKFCIKRTERYYEEEGYQKPQDEPNSMLLANQSSGVIQPADLVQDLGSLKSRKRRIPRPPPPKNPYLVPVVSCNPITTLEERDSRRSLNLYLHASASTNLTLEPLSFNCFSDQIEEGLFISLQIVSLLDVYKKKKASRTAVHKDLNSLDGDAPGQSSRNYSGHFQFDQNDYRGCFGRFSSYSVICDRQYVQTGDNIYSLPYIGFSLQNDPSQQSEKPSFISNVASQQSNNSVYEAQRWYAPETINNKTIANPEIDVFSLGMVMYELLSHNIPFHEIDAVSAQRQIGNGYLPAYHSAGNERWVDLIMRCLSYDPIDRPPLEEVREELISILGDTRHQFFKQLLSLTAVPPSADSVGPRGSVSSMNVGMGSVRSVASLSAKSQEMGSVRGGFHDPFADLDRQKVVDDQPTNPSGQTSLRAQSPKIDENVLTQGQIQQDEQELKLESVDVSTPQASLPDSISLSTPPTAFDTMEPKVTAEGPASELVEEKEDSPLIQFTGGANDGKNEAESASNPTDTTATESGESAPITQEEIPSLEKKEEPVETIPVIETTRDEPQPDSGSSEDENKTSAESPISSEPKKEQEEENKHDVDMKGEEKEEENKPEADVKEEETEEENKPGVDVKEEEKREASPQPDNSEQISTPQQVTEDKSPEANPNLVASSDNLIQFSQDDPVSSVTTDADNMHSANTSDPEIPQSTSQPDTSSQPVQDVIQQEPIFSFQSSVEQDFASQVDPFGNDDMF
ncbi:hypothetical protein BLNAU_16818 [Blattamonas nauphoetae]|uniref:Protein kinase domain-containing protein n=1 Tax=Blattamonas nauphoetae TaxID=2049346 RepID=A0ABQ9XC97_9EUKA|nr:hypothetical protein BLNAU_16818 [Blattamonas nauphoetae]